MSLLTVEGLEARHGLLRAVRGVDLALGEGETLALVGANGAGKTTLLRTIAGAHRVAAGRICLDGAEITTLPAHRRLQRGIALVPEGRQLFTGMTVEENLRVAEGRGRTGRWTLATVLEAFPQLRPKLKARAGDLSGGQQQAAAIARALMSNPRLLLLDEVSLGLSPVAVDQLYVSLQALLAGGATVILVEQDLGRALRVASCVVCLLEGRVTYEGAAQTTTREQVMEAYFGMAGGR